MKWTYCARMFGLMMRMTSVLVTTADTPPTRTAQRFSQAAQRPTASRKIKAMCGFTETNSSEDPAIQSRFCCTAQRKTVIPNRTRIVDWPTLSRQIVGPNDNDRNAGTKDGFGV